MRKRYPYEVVDLCLSNRADNALWTAGIKLTEQLTKKNARELLMLRNFGRLCLADVVAKLAEHGLSLAKTPHPTRVCRSCGSTVPLKIHWALEPEQARQ